MGLTQQEALDCSLRDMIGIGMAAMECPQERTLAWRLSRSIETFNTRNLAPNTARLLGAFRTPER